MSWVSEVKEICGDYCIDIKYHEEQTEAITLFFNSCRNAETVKRCIEDDDSIPNVATAVDFVEVVRCSECKYATEVEYMGCACKNEKTPWCNDEFEVYMNPTDFCSYGERRTE
jgi:hypothetical protein